jgi:hypothetical protein
MWFSTTTPRSSTQRSRLAPSASALHLPLQSGLPAPGPMRSKACSPSLPGYAQTRRIHIDRRAKGRHQPLHRGNQQSPQAVRLDQIRRRHPNARSHRRDHASGSNRWAISIERLQPTHFLLQFAILSFKRVVFVARAGEEFLSAGAVELVQSVQRSPRSAPRGAASWHT